MTQKTQQHTLKEYAKKYRISVLDDKGKFKTTNQLSLDIYNYEAANQKDIKHRTYYPYLKIKA
tara:strand:- start:1622 stop:1810 length:189 start_codon:yes stop_codon:yes gene_type:complete